MSTEQLKPCPFCGDKKCVAVVNASKTAHWIHCFKCEVMTPTFQTETEAVVWWNTRKNEDAMLAVMKKTSAWIARQADIEKASADTCSFQSLKKAYLYDSRNHRAMAKSLNDIIAQAEVKP